MSKAREQSFVVCAKLLVLKPLGRLKSVKPGSPRFRGLLAAGFVTMLVLVGICWLPSVQAWDSESGNPTRPTHSLLTEWAIDQLKNGNPQLQTFREAIVKGANCELHELPARNYEKDLGKKYGVDLEAKRLLHKGTNEGCDDIEGWWKDSLAEYKKGNKERAYFLLGIMLHMIEDMGVPAHANKVIHQGNATEFDNFEFMALSNWKPKFDDINRADPAFAEPWKYYAFSQKWTHDDAPNYHDRDSFSKFWFAASDEEKALLSNRQGRTCHLVKWSINAAIKAFAAP
jgi:hypothetical protein